MPLTPDVSEVEGLLVYDRSTVEVDGTVYCLVTTGEAGAKLLAVQGNTGDLEGSASGPGGMDLFPLSAPNAAVLRRRLPWLVPVPLGLKTSTGFGDRLGMATPGHVRALRRLVDAGERIGPVFAQQSVRENQRTGRTPQQVVDDATWGLLQEGWTGPWGADADHLKEPSVTHDFVDAGYTFFTIDPGDWVDDRAGSGPLTDLEERLGKLPWDSLEDSLADLERRYLGRSYVVEDGPARVFDRETLWRAAAKYGGAVNHTVAMYRHLVGAKGDRDFDLEVSVDETHTTTSVAEHFYIASELRRLDVQWVSLAPRFVGRFEKGVDYVGDPEIFAGEFSQHVAVAREMGPYKISLHSGSDKFSIYDVAANLAASADRSEGPLIHLKTAGTSYLEALRTVAQVDRPLFREILTYSRECFEVDRATYHVSARLEEVPASEALGDAELRGLLDAFDARQVLHVTFGSVLERFGTRLKSALGEHEEDHYGHLQAHFIRHLTPFVG